MNPLRKRLCPDVNRSCHVLIYSKIFISIYNVRTFRRKRQNAFVKVKVLMKNDELSKKGLPFTSIPFSAQHHIYYITGRDSCT